MIGRTLTLAAALFSAFVASQAPEFAQQYRQRLGGAVDELGRVVAQFDRDVARSGLDREQAIGIMTRDDETIVRLRGESIAADVERYRRLRAQLDAFQASGTIGRVEAVLTAPDRALVAATLDDYEPAVPTTPGGLLIAAAGFCLAYLVGGSLRFAPRLFRRRRRAADDPRLS